jgi:hypothetical protein
MKILTFLLLKLQGGRDGVLNKCYMKTGILFLLLVSAVTADAQTLKDILYSGKLKSDTNTVIRKGDDLSSKIDTSKKKPVEPEKIKTAISSKDASTKGAVGQTDAAAVAGADKKDNIVATKDNNKIWKEYLDSVISTFKTEVLPNSKIKEGTYYLLVEYEIGTDGQISINSVLSTPGNSWLQDQVKQRMTLTAPQMNPVLGTNNNPRKVLKKQNFTLVKEHG